MLVWCSQQIVVGIEELHIFARSKFQSCVSGTTQASILLANVDNAVMNITQVVDGRMARAIVNDDNLSLVFTQRQ